jgi:hypothetical protein
MKIGPTVKPILRENSDGSNTERKSETTGLVENVRAKTSLLSAVTVEPGYATDDVLNGVPSENGPYRTLGQGGSRNPPVQGWHGNAEVAGHIAGRYSARK